MNDLRAITEEEHNYIQKIIGSDSSVYENGIIVDRIIEFDDMADIVDFLRGQRKPPECVGFGLNRDWPKVGEKVTVYNNSGVLSGTVNHIDGRDVLVVTDWQCYMPSPTITKQEHQDSELGNMQVGGDHYQTKIQPVEFIHANGLPFIEGNVVKYISRHKAKGGAGDIEKAISYCKMLLKLEYGYTDEQIGKLFEKNGNKQ